MADADSPDGAHPEAGGPGAAGDVPRVEDGPRTQAGRQWRARRGGEVPAAPDPAVDRTLAERGFPHVDQWRMTPVHHRAPEGRKGFDEVAEGYLTDEEVRAEAARCIMCRHPTCISGCPNNNPIPTWLALVVEGRILDAAVADYEKDSLAACTGRVCNWEEQCEGWCVLNADGQGVRIGAVERYIADYAFRHREEFDRLRAQRAREEKEQGRSSYTRPDVSSYANAMEAYGSAVPGYADERQTSRRLGSADVPGYEPEDAPPEDTALDGSRVAVVGAGPAGLACADFLSRRGAEVTVFEAQSYPGGLLADGIPEFVLPQAVVDREVDRIASQGVRFRYGQVMGQNLKLDDLRREFDAVFVGVGAEVARRLDVAGQEADGILTAQSFLRAAKRALVPDSGLPRPTVGRHVLVIGAGNTSMDAARTSLRLGAEDVTVIYRRIRAESTSRDIEIDLATEEGVRFEYLVNPVAFLKDDAGRVRAARLVRMRLEAAPGGRPRPQPIPGSEYEVRCDMVLLAVGYSVHGLDLGHPEILNRDGTVHAHGEGGVTDVPGVFVGGDLVRGAYTVVHAIRDGRLASDAIGHYLLRRRAKSGPA
jgi:glutamate synthase (NADPH/NADH) small chain